MNKRSYGVFILTALLLSACTPDDYQKSADLQVNALVKDREQQTLGYTPQVDASVKTSGTVTPKSYEKVPLTPIPPTTMPAIEPDRYTLEYGKLGPELLFSPGTLPQQHEILTDEAARAPALERLKLGPPTIRADVIVLDLFSAIEYAVEHSRDYQNQMEDLYLAALDVTLQRHLFEPRPFANTGVLYSGGQRDVGYRSALSVTNTAGIKQQLPYGGEIIAQGLYDFVSAINSEVTDGESAQIALTGTIPLLRGAGMINLEPLINSERGMVYETRSFEDFRRQFAVNIASQYIRLLTQQQGIANRRFSYIASYQTWQQSLAIYAAGRPGTNFLSVQRAQSSLYQAENNIITAEDSYQSALDSFKISLGMPVDQPLQVVALELGVNPPDIDSDAVALALKYRLDLQTASDRIEDARRKVDNSKNQLLPDVELTAASAINNPQAANGNSGNALNGRTLTYSAGVSVDWPLDRVAERNAYRSSLIGLERAQRSWRETHDQIIAQVRDAVRSIRTARTSLQIQQLDIDNNRQRLDYANQLLILGRATDSQQAVDAQDNLLSAQDSYDTAKANYYIQILNFLRDTGTLRLDPASGALGTVMDRGNPTTPSALMSEGPTTNQTLMRDR
jgi:hypothetical protein